MGAQEVSGPIATALDGSRMHFQHGPIDLIVEAAGNPDRVRTAYQRGWHRFTTVLDELVGELPLLRRPLGERVPRRAIAVRMAEAVAPFAETYVTPMAAVAGAVADEICRVIEQAGVDKAYVNNGGDIALHLSADSSYDVGLVPVPSAPSLAGKATITGVDAVRGVATSGRHGRSFSLGIADAVTTLASSAAVADVAATLIANEVDLPGHPLIERVAATELDPDSDLGDTAVTVAVGGLEPEEVAEALERGASAANGMIGAGLVQGAVLCLNGAIVTVGGPRRVLALQAGATGEQR